MTRANAAAAPGAGQIKSFLFYGNGGNPLDVASACTELCYYESILDDTIRVTARFVDAGHRSSGEGSAAGEKDDLNLTVGEKAEIKIVDGNQVELDLSGDKHLRIELLKNMMEDNNFSVFTVDLFSKESIDNHLEKNRVQQRFDGLISDHVKKILTDVLKTPKKYKIDSTVNKLSYLPTTTKPFYQMAWFGARSVPDTQNAQGNLAGFFFFENYDGYQYRSIDKLFEQKPKKKIIYNELVEEKTPPGYDAKCVNYQFNESFDLHQMLLTGSQMNCNSKSLNVWGSNYRENPGFSLNQFNENNTGGKEQPLVAADLKLQEENTRIFNIPDAVGTLVEGKTLKDQLKKSTFSVHDNDAILKQSNMRYNNLFTVQVETTIPGDFSLRAGDLIHCDFPEVSGKPNQVVSEKKGGTYLISELCHRLSKGSCYTRMSLVRESTGRKPMASSNTSSSSSVQNVSDISSGGDTVNSQDSGASLAPQTNNSKYDLDFDQPLKGNEKATSYSGATLGDFETSRK